jgi:hypothetical protein
MSLAQKFVKHYQHFSPNLKKALGSGDVPALTPAWLSKLITTTLFRRDPLGGKWSSKRIPTKEYPLREIDAWPTPESAVGELPTTPYKDIVFGPETKVKPGINSRKFRTGNYMRWVAEKFGSHEMAQKFDILGRIITEQVNSFGTDLTMARYWGNQTANQYSFDGIYRNCTAARKNRFNLHNTGNPWQPDNTEFLDQLISQASDFNAEAPDQRPQTNMLFVMSARMLGTLSQQEKERIRVETTPEPLFRELKFPGGIRMESYRGIPIAQSLMAGGGPYTPEMGLIALADFPTGGTLIADTYYFQVGFIGYSHIARSPFYGESISSGEANIPIGAGTANRIEITWSDEPKAMYYIIYARTLSGGEPYNTPIAVIPANTYDGTGTPTGRVTSYNVTTMVPDASAAGMEEDLPNNAPADVAGETIALIDYDPMRMGSLFTVHEGGNEEGGDVIFRQLAENDLLYLDHQMLHVGGHIPYYPYTTSLVRGVRP